MAAIVQPARPRLCRRGQASLGSGVCSHLDGVLAFWPQSNPAVVLGHLAPCHYGAIWTSDTWHHFITVLICTLDTWHYVITVLSGPQTPGTMSLRCYLALRHQAPCHYGAVCTASDGRHMKQDGQGWLLDVTSAPEWQVLNSRYQQPVDNGRNPAACMSAGLHVPC